MPTRPRLAHAATVHMDHGHGYGTGTWRGPTKETHRLVGLKQNMELYSTMGRGAAPHHTIGLRLLLPLGLAFQVHVTTYKDTGPPS